MDGLFMPILAQHAQVRDALVQMTKSEHRAGLQCDFTNSVSLHVRLGDFAATPHQDDPHRPATNTRVPMHWYVDMLQGIRARQGRAVQAYIFSDGTDEELAPLLALDNCLRIGFGSAIADLLALSRAEILIASGSTFSMWASYLGRMPVIWPPGHKKQSLYGNSGVLEAELSTFG